MRTRLGAHLAGLLAAAGMPLTAADFGRLAGRPAARIAELLPEASTVDVRVADGGWEAADADAVARIVRNLHAGPLAAGAEHRREVQELALRPFRAAMHAAIASAREEWGWDAAPPFALSPAFPASMLTRPRERRALVRLLTDRGRAGALTAHHPDAARRQLLDAATTIAAEATTPADLEDLAMLLLARSRLDPVDGAVPRRLAPVVALLGDLDRAVALAHHVRTDVAIELAYVAYAAAQAGDQRADEVAERSLALLGDAPAGALLRTAQAIAGLALYLPADRARIRAQQARALVHRAFAEPERPPSVESLRSRQFRASRDHEWALAATTSATVAVALAQAEDRDAATDAVREARDAAAAVADLAHRGVALADVATRLAVRTTAGHRLPVLDAAADAAGSAALSAAEETDDAAAFAAIAALLSGGADRDGDRPEPPAAPDTVRAAAAARRALASIASGGGLPARGALRDAARSLRRSGASPGDLSSLAARAVVERVQSARHSTSLERRTRARTEAAVLAEAAVVLDAAGAAAEARAAAAAAREACGRVPAAARARPLADVASALLGAVDDEVFEAGCAAAGAERGGTEGIWDAAAPALVAATALALLTHDSAGRTPDGGRRARVTDIWEQSVLALRLGEHAPSLTLLADRAARRGDSTQAGLLVAHALRAAHAPDPLRRERARAALASTASPASAAGDGPAPDVPLTARAWLADGYPIADLALLAASDPEVGGRIAAAVRAELGRRAS